MNIDSSSDGSYKDENVKNFDINVNTDWIFMDPTVKPKIYNNR